MRSSKRPVTHLHNHSSHSVRDALQKLDAMCAAAVADGQAAIAITDHGNLGASWKFADAASAVGIKSILGSELYLAHGSRHAHETMPAADDDELGAGGGDSDVDRSSGAKTSKYHHLTVLAQNQAGWRNLLIMSNEAHDSDAFWHKPRVDMDLLSAHSEGLIVLTGCLGGPVAGPLALGDTERAEANLGALYEMFGAQSTSENRLFVEVMDHAVPAERRVLAELVRLAAKFGLPVVATNDAHYTHPHEATAHDAWLCVGGDNVTLDSTNRWSFPGEGYHLRSTAEMRAIFDDQPGTEAAIDNSSIIADMIEDRVLPEAGQLRLPHYRPTAVEVAGQPPVPEGDDPAYRLLFQKVRAGARERYGEPDGNGGFGPPPDAVQKRLRYELKVISDAGLADYFLIVADMIGWARSDGIRVGSGRGSAGGSVCSYCLGIITIDPLAHGLLFERFLNPSRAGMPDIDTDFEQAAVPRVIDYLRQRWGEDRVARIGTVGMSLAAASLRSAGKVTGQGPLGARLADKVTQGPAGKSLSIAALEDTANADGAPFRAEVASDPGASGLVEIARSFEGQVNNEGIHACGVLISDKALPGLVPLRRDRRSDRDGGLVTEWDGHDIESFGLLKLDVLGIRNLDVISACVRIVAETTGEAVAAEDPPTDPEDSRAAAAWRLIAEGRTAGVFQLEGSGMARLAMQIAPTSVDELAAVIALFRPGPLGEGMDQRYAARKAGAEPVDYGFFTDDPAEAELLSSVLGETYAAVVFQEQFMRLGEVVAGFGPVERNRLQRAISKKKRDEMDAVGKLFIEGALACKAIDGSAKLAFAIRTAERVWATMKGAGDYAFVKAHSIGYAKTAYITAYLKANWPAAFGAGLLSVTDGDDKRLAVLRSLRAEGVVVAGPDINVPAIKTTVDSAGAVRLGLGEIKGVGVNAEAVVAEHRENGPFRSMADLLERVSVYDAASGQHRRLQVNIVEAMVEAGAFDGFGLGRQGLCRALRAQREWPETPVAELEWGVVERAARERARLGVQVSTNPLQALAGRMGAWMNGGPRSCRPVPIHKIGGPGSYVATIGVVAHFEIAKKGRRRAYMTLEGSVESVDCILWSNVLEGLEARGEVPYVGEVIGVDAKVREGRVAHNPDPDDTVNPDAVIEDRKELTVTVLWRRPIEDPSTGSLGALHVPERLPTQVAQAPLPQKTPQPHKAPQPQKIQPEIGVEAA